VVGYPGRVRRRARRRAIAATRVLATPGPTRTPAALTASLVGASVLLVIESLTAGLVATEAMLAGPLASGQRAARAAAQEAAQAAQAAVEVAAASVPPEAHLDRLSPPQLPLPPALPAVIPVPLILQPLQPAAPLPPSVPIRPAMDHLPLWVQTRQPAGLLSGPDAAAVRFTTLPAWTFLKVVGVQADRLHVEYAGDGGLRKPGPGWVALDDVQPSDASGDWLRNHHASELFDAPIGGKKSLADVPQSSPMLALDPPAGERAHARVYSADYKRVLGEGWIPASDVGPAGPPDRAIDTQSVQAPPAPFASRDEFIGALGKAARDSRDATGVPASVTVAQAILESDWGESLLTRLANNYFGIKAMGQVGNDGAVWMRTMEYDARGAAYYTLAPFRAYKSLADGVTDHSQLFLRVPVYRSAMQATDNPDEFARRIAAAGYSTDPAYPSKLIGLMTRYNLYRFDQP
jgi:Mannosyl-glycoprotein endo-beta-N-acetylglucosaminidase